MKDIILDKCKYTTDAVDTTVYSAGCRTIEALGLLSYQAHYLGPEGLQGSQAYMLRKF